MDKETYDRLRFAQALLRHQIPDGDIAAIFSHALKAHVERALQQKVAVTERPRGAGGPTNLHSRHIPAEVKRAVWLRDGGRCAYVSRTGRRCKEEGFLQFHHRKAFADGGEATVENVELRCAAHNRYEAEQVFGPRRTRAVRERAVKWQAVSVESTTGSGPGSSDPTRSFDIARGMPWNQRKAASSGAGARLRPG
ncbi:MAG TPA: HNH endonuclease signature motif containing protein [Anaerolineales bacterium]